MAAGLAFYAGLRDRGGGMQRLGWAIVLVILINGLFSFWQEARAERAIEALDIGVAMGLLGALRS